MAREEKLTVDTIGGDRGAPPINLDMSVEELKQLAARDPEAALKLMDLREKLNKRLKDEETAVRLSAEQRQKLEAIDAQIQATYAMQQDCLHTKENGRPALSGVRDSRNDTHYICLRCAKSWVNSQLPHHLRTGLPEIGGPQYT